MTKRATVTQAHISRAIRAAMKAGLRVRGIAPDGTVLVGDDNDAPGKIASPVPEPDDHDWSDE